MTYSAAVEVDVVDGTDVPLTLAEDVDALVELLQRDNIGAATIQDGEEDAVLDVRADGEYGYLAFWGDELTGLSVGDPASPALHEQAEIGFPAGTGVPLDKFRAALVEFVETHGHVPSAVEWRATDGAGIG
ncbi:hypothetical protein GCM10009676_45340 [Prauserella halophila]|uniref:Immunity protein Imm1 n=1 Tax=Prauserella halophila TaxID=185641 RepID=A0ABP4HA31_9PSEU|nr:Imm1 family immunity protein [Prauserella halophila]MCP2237607.1 Immunity protein Imm1 [Prauserella halophila]